MCINKKALIRCVFVRIFQGFKSNGTLLFTLSCISNISLTHQSDGRIKRPLALVVIVYYYEFSSLGLVKYKRHLLMALKPITVAPLTKTW